MTRYVAFLRGLNVGGHTVAMDDLRRHVEALGLASVSTFIASGNVLFASDEDPAALAPRIEAGLRAALGYEVATFLRSDAEVAAVAAHAPFSRVEPRAGDTMHVVFLRSAPEGAVRERYLALASERDLLHVAGREVYWLRRGSFHESSIKDSDWARAGARAPVTVRNVNTVRRLAARLYPTAEA